jgi:hypothetical protein
MLDQQQKLVPLKVFWGCVACSAVSGSFKDGEIGKGWRDSGECFSGWPNFLSSEMIVLLKMYCDGYTGVWWFGTSGSLQYGKNRHFSSDYY